MPAEYRTKNDARVAVVSRALEEGVLEFIRFRGQPPPPDYDPATYRSGKHGASENDKVQEKSLEKIDEDDEVEAGEIIDTAMDIDEPAISEGNKGRSGKESSSTLRQEAKSKRKGKRSRRDGRVPRPPTDPDLSRISAAATEVIERLTRSANENALEVGSQASGSQPSGFWKSQSVASSSYPSQNSPYLHSRPVPTMTPFSAPSMPGPSTASSTFNFNVPSNPRESSHSISSLSHNPQNPFQPTAALLTGSVNKSAQMSATGIVQPISSSATHENDKNGLDFKETGIAISIFENQQCILIIVQGQMI